MINTKFPQSPFKTLLCFVLVFSVVFFFFFFFFFLIGVVLAYVGGGGGSLCSKIDRKCSQLGLDPLYRC